MGLIFSGVQPTNNPHLGNYLGAIRNWVKLQDRFDGLYCIVDLHAITVWQDPAALRQQTREIAATYLAAGIDPKKQIVFNQSQVAGHAQLAWILNCVARLGWMNRMTQFKEKSGKDREGVSVGLYTYPTLMAADILLYRATHVPVGEDQKQHVELARDIAQKFNNDFGREFFPLPEPMIFGTATRVMSLRDGSKKMSKSDPSEYSRINLTDDADAIQQKIRKAKTDAALLPDDTCLNEQGELSSAFETGRPEAANLLGIYAALADRPVRDIVVQFEGKNFSDLKSQLADLMVETVGQVGAEIRRLIAAPDYIDGVLRDGADRAQAVAAPILREVEDIVGFLRP